MTENHKLRVFLCHASQDKPIVRELYQRLNAEGWIDPWLDEEKLLPGQDWDAEIEKAVEAADVVIVCLSNKSVTKEGYVQKEIRKALNKAEEKPDGIVYIIPILLDNCSVPHKMKKWQWVDFSSNYGWYENFNRLINALKVRAKSIDISVDGNVVISDSGYYTFTFFGMEFSKVLAGRFLMGSSEAIAVAPHWEKPEHVCALHYDYWLGRYPVTKEQFAKYREAKGLSFEIKAGRGSYPVDNVDYRLAQDYIAWLNSDSRNQLPLGYRFGLPSEAEWEKAARGTNGRIYPWGNDYDQSKCNTDIVPITVGSFSPQGDSVYGIADMVGNISQWTRSLWGENQIQPKYSYPYISNDGRENENAARVFRRVTRGSLSGSLPINLRCAIRNHSEPDRAGIFSGFRVAIIPV